MQDNSSIFRLGIMGIFGLLLLAGVFSFATFTPESSSAEIGSVEIWGTYDSRDFKQFLEVVQGYNKAMSKVKYTQISESNFDTEVLEALASGQSPDLLFVDETKIKRYLNKTFTLTSESYTKRTFQENFVELAEVYFQNNGIVALPLAADPLVMYWNRDLFSSAGLARAPKSWPEFFDLSGDLSIVDDSLNVRQSAIAFGETQNVNYFREIIATLLFQIGNPVIREDSNGVHNATLKGEGSLIESAFPVVRFFTEFSDASKAVYSWNRSLPTAEEQFLAGKLAVYFAPASEIQSLRRKNPNLNFAIAEIPAVDEDVSRRKSVHATLYGFMIPKASNNVGGAFAAAVEMTSINGQNAFTGITTLAPTRRDLVVSPSSEVYQDVLKSEALYAQTFLDPNKQATEVVLSDMIGYITSGQRSIDNAITISNNELDELLQK